MSCAYSVTCAAALLPVFVCRSRYKEVKENLPFVSPDYGQCNVAKVIDGVNPLAYAYLPGRVQGLNSLKIGQGYAEYSGKPPNVKDEKYFLRLECKANKNGKGLWGEDRQINKRLHYLFYN